MESVGDDATSRIGQYTGEPPSWNKYVNKHLACKPTADRYRVLRHPDEPCPEEAPHAEPQSRCCTGDSEDEEYLKMLQTVAMKVPKRKFVRLAPNIRRLVAWAKGIKLPPPEHGRHWRMRPILIDELDPRLTDIVKFALMTKSNVIIRMMRNNAPETLEPLTQNGSLFIHSSSSAYPGIFRIMEDFGVSKLHIELESHPGQQIVNLPSLRADDVEIKSHRLPGPQFVDISDITRYFETNHHTHSLSSRVPCIHRHTTTFHDEVRRLFRVLHGRISNGDLDLFAVGLTLENSFTAPFTPPGYTVPDVTSLDALSESLWDLMGQRHGEMSATTHYVFDSEAMYSYIDTNNETQYMSFQLTQLSPDYLLLSIYPTQPPQPPRGLRAYLASYFW